MAYTTNWKIVAPNHIGYQPIASTSATKQHELGTTVQARDHGSNQNGMGEFVYVKGVANGLAGSVVTINADDGTVTLAVANAVGPVGVLMSALTASLYGWAQIKGKAVGLVLAGFADNADCYLTSTDGSVDDTDVAGDYVRGMKGASAIDGPATGFAELELFYPQVADGKDN